MSLNIDLTTNSFQIQNTTLATSKNIEDKFSISSFPENYEVVFDKVDLSFSKNQVLLIDSKVKDIYKIKHEKTIEIEATESNKSMETVLDICSRLASFNFTKKDTLVVIGGGILQDLGAFSAKMFKRGVNWVFYPTTLLAQCDSCIGGKTALNYQELKNQLALFSAPKKVIIDTDFLKTLSDQDITSGYGEIIKIFLIGGDFYLDHLDIWSLKDKIKHALFIKKTIIEADEFEKMERKSLNYGHSFGHAIEPMTNYKIPHGESVILGIEIINQLFDRNPKISKLISKFTSLDKIKDLDTKKLTQSLLSDKKVSGNSISFIRVPEAGVCIYSNVDVDHLLEEKVHEIFTN